MVDCCLSERKIEIVEHIFLTKAAGEAYIIIGAWISAYQRGSIVAGESYTQLAVMVRWMLYVIRARDPKYWRRQSLLALFAK